MTDRLFFGLLVLLYLLHVADSWTTYQLLQAGGRELNPLGAWCFAHWGFGLSIAVKLLTVQVAAYLFWRARSNALARGVVYFSLLLGLVAVSNNLYQILKAL